MSTNRLNKRWLRRALLFNQAIPARTMDWLFDVSSLTRRLLQRCPQSFRVEVLSQRMARPSLDEARVLGISSGHYALIREVLLYCGDEAVVYARTVIPRSTLSGAQRCYANLGSRPLGAMLFADRSMRRGEVEVSRLSPEDGLCEKLRCHDEAVWGRRSVFYVGGKPLLVSEFFLPAIYR